METRPAFTEEERLMLLEAVADRVANLQLAISKRSQTQIKMEERLTRWQSIHSKLQGDAHE